MTFQRARSEEQREIRRQAILDTALAMLEEMPVAEMITQYGARPEGSESKLSTYRDGWRIMRTILTLFRIERPVRPVAALEGLVHGERPVLVERQGDRGDRHALARRSGEG